jgi:hypothetical protein
MASYTPESLARQLEQAGYDRLFLSGGASSAGAVWDGGASRAALEQVVRSAEAPDVSRILASEVLAANVADYPPADLQATLAELYPRALALSGVEAGLRFPGNAWGFLFHSARAGIADDGPLGNRLVAQGPAAVPHLAALLDDGDRLLYQGSQDATLGNSLGYRVKDAAAYFIGKLSGIPVTPGDDLASRDAAVARLREAIRSQSDG